jgi:hypothetical protein
VTHLATFATSESPLHRVYSSCQLLKTTGLASLDGSTPISLQQFKQGPLPATKREYLINKLSMCYKLLSASVELSHGQPTATAFILKPSGGLAPTKQRWPCCVYRFLKHPICDGSIWQPARSPKKGRAQPIASLALQPPLQLLLSCPPRPTHSSMQQYYVIHCCC